MKIKQRENGYATIYVHAGHESGVVIADIFSKRRFAGVSVRPLRSGKVAIDVRNTPEGIALITEVLGKQEQYVKAVEEAIRRETQERGGLFAV